MTMFQKLKKLLWLPLAAALSQGCSGCTDVVDSGATLKGYGFASDTTAILFYELWEKTDSPAGFGQSGSGTNYYGWELKLVDVRFHKVYWESQIDYGRGNSRILSGVQWNDSTMLIELTGEGYWLWTVGNKKPQKIIFKGNTEMESYNTFHFRVRPWKNDYVLVSFSGDKHFIIDSKTMTVSDWSPIGENTWTTSCNDFWWGKNGGGCLKNNEPYSFTLLSEKGEVLGNFTYAHECVTYYDDKCSISNYRFFNSFIMAGLYRCVVGVCDTCPIKNKICGASYAFIRYDDKWNINREPSFWWLLEGEEFADSLGNITRY